MISLQLLSRQSVCKVFFRPLQWKSPSEKRQHLFFTEIYPLFIVDMKHYCLSLMIIHFLSLFCLLFFPKILKFSSKYPFKIF